MSKEMNYISSFSSQLDLLESEGRNTDISNCILSMMIRNFDLSPLAGKIIKLLAVPYPPCKKVLYTFLTRYSRNIADLNILATNNLLKDFQDPNPFIRKLVIKTISSIPCLYELAFQLIPQALCDSSSYVRCTAASSCSFVINDANVKDNQDIINKLYEMIRDPDPSVVCSSLTALNEILQSDGGVVINSKITFYLFKRIADFQDWNFSVIYAVLKKYLPKNNDELLYFLNALDDKLLDSNPAVFPLAADLALYYNEQLDKNFSGDIVQQVSPQLKFLLDHSNSEALAALLDVIASYLPKQKGAFVSFYKLFFCRFCDSILVKVKKLKILVHLINSSNVSDIADELLSQGCDHGKEVSGQAIHSFTEVIRAYPQMSGHVRTFISLMDIHHNNLSSEILNALGMIDLNVSSDIKATVLSAISKHSQNVNSVDSKLALLKFVGYYGDEISDAPYIIERFLNDDSMLNNEKLAGCLLLTTVKLFLIRPAETQLLLGSVLHSMKNSPCLLLQKQASVYYCLLNDAVASKKIILDFNSFSSTDTVN